MIPSQRLFLKRFLVPCFFLTKKKLSIVYMVLGNIVVYAKM